MQSAFELHFSTNDEYSKSPNTVVMNSNYSAESPSFVFAKNKVILALGDSGS
jgi:hypothetical protein